MSSPAISTKWLVVGAWEPELTRFRELAFEGEGLNRQSGLVVEAVGIGLVDAAIGMTRCIERHRPTDVLFVGTCGSLGKHAVGDVVIARSIGLFDRAIADSEAVKLSPLTIDLESRFAIDLPRVSVANTIGVTVSDDLAKRLAALYDVEHLEAFAVARASANVACTIMLGIANMVGKDGSAEWKKNHERVSGIVAERAVDHLRARAFRTSKEARSPEQA